MRAEQALRDAVARQTTLLDMNEFRLEVSDLLRRLNDPAQIFVQTGAMLGRFLQASRVLYGDYDADKQLVTFHSNYTDGIVAELNGTFPAALFGVANFSTLSLGTGVERPAARPAHERPRRVAELCGAADPLRRRRALEPQWRADELSVHQR